MSEPRNAYGFPCLDLMREQMAMMEDMNRAYEGRPSLKLERAQAIAAEVRARKFPAPRRIATKDE